LLYQDWVHHALTPVRIPAARLDDWDFLQALSVFVARRNWITGSGGGIHSVVVRSASIGLPQLSALRDRIAGTTHVLVTTEVIHSASDCVPEASKLVRSGRWRSEQPSQFAAETAFVLDSPRPRHFGELAPVPPILRRATGRWI
jgi:hypothetical protein